MTRTIWFSNRNFRFSHVNVKYPLAIAKMRIRYAVSKCTTVQPQYNEVPRYWQNLFAITRFRYIEVLFHLFCCYWDKQNPSLYRGLRYIEVLLYGGNILGMLSLLSSATQHFSLTLSVSTLWNRRKRLHHWHEKRVQPPQDCLDTPTWPPFHCFGTPYGRDDVMWKCSIAHFGKEW